MRVVALKNGYGKWMRGRKPNPALVFRGPHLEKTRLQISATTKKKGIRPPIYMGKNHWNWKGGESTKKERRTLNESRRRALAANSNGRITLNQWTELKKKYNFICPSCFVGEPNIKLTIDHIVPLSMGGRHEIGNIQPLCGSCNCKKHTRILKYASPIGEFN